MICSLIQPNLWVGPALRVDQDFGHLQLLKITAILSLQDEGERGYGGVESERAEAARAGLAFESVPIKDFNNSDLQLRLPDCVTALARLVGQGHTPCTFTATPVSRGRPV